MSEAIQFSDLSEGDVLAMRSELGTTFELRIIEVCDDGCGHLTQSLLRVEILDISRDDHGFDLDQPAELKLNDCGIGPMGSNLPAFSVSSINYLREGYGALLCQDALIGAIEIESVHLQS